MKAKALESSSSRWPAAIALPLYDPSRERVGGGDSVRFPRQASVGPIELRIGGSDGPSAIAILE